MTTSAKAAARVGRTHAAVVILAALCLVLGIMSVAPQARAATTSVPASAASGAVASGIVKAADLSKFQPGNIITDAVFFNSNSMSAAQIQAFLEAKVPTCQSGYTCLKDWYDTSRSTSPDAMCGAYSGGMSERASTIIYKVAQACGINPQVILATLEKEQGLVTHVWPSTWRYTIAMGQGCPDTAACDTRYYGFFNQVYGAAWQFKRYANPPGTSNYFNWYAPGKTWNVRWNPNAACGSSPVYIENQATANLYYYTPYQPNAAAIRAGYGLGDSCSSYGNRNFYQNFTDWFGSTGSANANDPFGNVEVVESQPGAFRVRGWAADPNTAAPIQVHVYVNGNGYPITADQDRPDVGAAYPTLGSRHGFDASVPASGPGVATICLYGINAGLGTNALFGCVTRGSMSGSPFGALDGATNAVNAVDVFGWSIDPDSTQPTDVHVYVGPAGTRLRGDVSRPDVGAVYPAYGSAHGFRATIPAAAGTYSVCAYGINTGPGASALLGCRTVTVTGQVDTGRPPFGAFDSATVTGNTARVWGWAIDPDTLRPVTVQVSVNGTITSYTADSSRPDVGTAYPTWGATHGFEQQVTLPLGQSQICVTAINNGAGGNTALGCRTVAVAETDNGKDPVGYFDSLTVSGTTATATGWTLDPDTGSAIPVHLYVNGVGTPYVADKPRPDVGSAYPANGSNHGFVEQLALGVGTFTVCAFGINTGRGSNTALGCRTVTIAAPATPPAATGTKLPIGVFDSATPTAGGAAIFGWAIDPDTTAPIQVHVYVGAVGRAYLADKSRPDVDAVYHMGAGHGFSEVVPLTTGSYRLCAYAIDSTGAGNPLIGCRDVTIP